MCFPAIQTDRRFFASLFSGLLILQLAVPSSVLALRETSPEQGPQKAALEEHLLSAGLEESEQAKAINAYREKVEAVRLEMQRLKVQTDLRPGEVWMLGQLTGPEGHALLVPMDQKVEDWIPPVEGPGDKPWNVLYTLGIGVQLLREWREIQKKAEHDWRKKPPFKGRLGLVLGQEIVSHPSFKTLREGKIPVGLERHFPPGPLGQEIFFLTQGEDPDLLRWKRAQRGLTVQEAIAAGAIGYKTNVMIPVMMKGQEYAVYWQRLAGTNNAWVKQRAQEARESVGGLGFGYAAGAIFWPAPPKSYVPEDPKMPVLQGLPDLSAELQKDELAEWAIETQMEGWLRSREKVDLEQTEEFALAHQKATEWVVGEWSQTAGITLIMVAGPYLVSTEEQWEPRAAQTQAAIEKLARLNGGIRGKILPISRGRPWELVNQELKVMAQEKLAAGAAPGRALLRRFVNDETKQFERLGSRLFQQKGRLAAVYLSSSLDALQENGAPSVWDVHGISSDQAGKLITAARKEPTQLASGSTPSTAGLEASEVQELAAAAVGAEFRERVHGVLQELQLLPQGDLQPLLDAGLEEGRYKEQLKLYL